MRNRINTVYWVVTGLMAAFMLMASVPDVLRLPQAVEIFGHLGYPTYLLPFLVITLAHSNQDGLFRDGAFTSIVAAGQAASCWTTRAGKYVFVANTASRTISRLIGTGNNVFVDAQIAAQVSTGSPADIDADAGVLGVIDHGAGQSHLSTFAYNAFGELAPAGAVITVGVANANGVAILSPREGDEN